MNSLASCTHHPYEKPRPLQQLPSWFHIEQAAMVNAVRAVQAARAEAAKQQAAAQMQVEPIQQLKEPQAEVCPSPPRKWNPLSGLLHALKAPRLQQAARGREWQLHDVLQAIDKQDLIRLGDIRTAHFSLLLREEGGLTPLVYAMTLGPNYRGVAVTLVGFLSSWINQKTAASLQTEENRKLAAAVKKNLIYVLQSQARSFDHAALVASYLVLLVMVQGDDWLREQIDGVAYLVSRGQFAKALHQAEATMLNQAKVAGPKKLANEPVENGLFNAQTDLFLLGCLRSMQGPGKTLPLHLFARDEQVIHAVEKTIPADTEGPRSGRIGRISGLVTEAALILKQKNRSRRERWARLLAACETLSLPAQTPTEQIET